MKADLLLGLPSSEGLAPDSTSAQIEAWLADRGLDNLVIAAARDFEVVRYFLVSSLDQAIEPDGTAMKFPWASSTSISPAQR